VFAAMAAHTTSQLGDQLALVVESIAAEFDAKVVSFDGDMDQEAVSGAVTCHCADSRTCVLVFVFFYCMCQLHLSLRSRYECVRLCLPTQIGKGARWCKCAVSIRDHGKFAN